MDSFWEGFYKKAESVIELWQGQSDEEDKAKKKDPKFDSRTDPVTLSQSYTPDVYWRSYP